VYRSFLAWRYLVARRTNLIGIVGIFVAVAALILILSIMAGFLAESRKHLRGNLADLVITPADGRIEHGQEPSRDLERMLALIESDPRVVAATPQLVWYGLVLPEFAASAMERPMQDAITLVELVGIDHEREAKVTSFGESLRKDFAVKFPTLGRPDDISNPFALPKSYRPESRPKPPMIVGEQLGHVWQLRKGDEVPVLTATIDRKTQIVNEEPSKQSFVIAGSFRSGENEMDFQRAYFDRRDLADYLALNEGPDPRDFSSVLVRLHDYERDKEAVRAELYQKLHDEGFLHDPKSPYREITTWEDRRQNLLRAIENERALMGIMLSLVLVVAGFTVFALLSMMVSEKRRDIGILSALGATPSGVMTLFLLIGLWQALLGAALGAGAGIWAALRIDTIERWLSSTFGFQIFNRDVYFFDHIPSVIEPIGVSVIVGGAVFLTLMFAAIPAWRAARLNPVDALRYE
jgi:lipoprotein-releasing system permease protein